MEVTDRGGPILEEGLEKESGAILGTVLKLLGTLHKSYSASSTRNSSVKSHAAQANCSAGRDVRNWVWLVLQTCDNRDYSCVGTVATTSWQARHVCGGMIFCMELCAIGGCSLGRWVVRGKGFISKAKQCDAGAWEPWRLEGAGWNHSARLVFCAESSSAGNRCEVTRGGGHIFRNWL